MIMLFLLACNGSEIRKLKKEISNLKLRNNILTKSNQSLKAENNDLKEQVEKQFYTTPEGVRAKLKSDAIKKVNEKREIERSWCDISHSSNYSYRPIEVLPYELRSNREILIKRCDGSNCAICNLTLKEEIKTPFSEIESIVIKIDTYRYGNASTRLVKITRKDKTVADYTFYNMRYFSASY